MYEELVIFHGVHMCTALKNIFFLVLPIRLTKTVLNNEFKK